MALTLLGKNSKGLAMELFDTADEKLRACSFHEDIEEILNEKAMEIAVLFDRDNSDNSQQGILAYVYFSSIDNYL